MIRDLSSDTQTANNYIYYKWQTDDNGNLSLTTNGTSDDNDFTVSYYLSGDSLRGEKDTYTSYIGNFINNSISSSVELPLEGLFLI